MSDTVKREKSMDQVAQLPGREGLVDALGFSVRVQIIEYKLAYGRILVRISPTAGEGSAWVYLSRVTLEPAD